MFEKIRKPGKTKKMVNYVIFGLICLVFIFIGVPVSQLSTMGGAALIVNNKVISWSEYQKYLEILEKQQSQGTFGEEEAERYKQLRRRAIDTLLNTELIVQEAVRLGVLIANKEIQDKVVELPFFQEEGRFMHSKYRAFLEAQRFTASYFENLIRKEIQTARFQGIFNLSLHTSNVEKQKKEQLSNLSVQISYIQFPSADLKPEEFNRINNIVEAGDEDLFSQVLKDKNWKWEAIESFDLTRVSVPGLKSSKRLFDEVLHYLPNTGMIKKVINLRDQAFILKVESFTQNKQKEKPQHLPMPDSFFTDLMTTRTLFLSWISFAKSLAKLKINPRLQSVLQD